MELPSVPLDLYQSLMTSQRVSLIPHEIPDADALGSTLALGRALSTLNKDVNVLVGNEVRAWLRFLPGFDRFVKKPSEDAVRFLHSSDLVLICDTHEPTLLGPWLPEIERLMSRDTSRLLVVDHHVPRGDVRFPIGWLDPSQSSTSEMALAIIKRLGCQIDREIAQNLMAGIIWDTTRFSNTNTHPQTLLCAAELVEHGADVTQINMRLFSLGSPAAVRFRGAIYRNLRAELAGRYVWVALTRALMEQYQADSLTLTGLSNELRLVEGAKIVAVLVESGENEIRVSLRGNDGYNVERIARRFPSGGGHAAAAGCTIYANMRGAAQQLRREIRTELT